MEVELISASQISIISDARLTTSDVADSDFSFFWEINFDLYNVSKDKWRCARMARNTIERSEGQFYLLDILKIYGFPYFLIFAEASPIPAVL